MSELDEVKEIELSDKCWKFIEIGLAIGELSSDLRKLFGNTEVNIILDFISVALIKGDYPNALALYDYVVDIMRGEE